MIDFPSEQVLTFLGALPFGDVDGYAAYAHHTTGLVDRCCRGADAPANFTIGSIDPKLGLMRSFAPAELGDRQAQLMEIAWMKQRLDVRGRHHKVVRIDPKDLELPLVPHPVAVDPVPIPRTHSPGRKGEAPALFAFEKSRV